MIVRSKSAPWLNICKRGEEREEMIGGGEARSKKGQDESRKGITWLFFVSRRGSPYAMSSDCASESSLFTLFFKSGKQSLISATESQEEKRGRERRQSHRKRYGASEFCSTF